MTKSTFLWHDYETFGADPARDRPSQFAGIRTDEDFNIIGEPIVVFCKPAADMLPQPQACLITGITPQHAAEKGVCEADFIRQIHRELALPGTCAVGYNSIRFDDEVSRYTLYRNFYDPYAREWQNGNSRWDIIDMLRVCCALRPEGINWPTHDDGTPSFKLEQLTVANGISHESAHDALSDVYATIEMAKLVKVKQPKLFEYFFSLRSKKAVSSLLNVADNTPVVHTSAMFPASVYCTSLVMPLAMHPTNSNGVICFDLRADPSTLIELPAEQVAQRLFTPAAEMPEGIERIALKTIHVNRCPVVATSKLLNPQSTERIQLDMNEARKHYKLLRDAKGLSLKLQEVFSGQSFPVISDPDLMLYSGGFFGKNDSEAMSQIRNCTAEELAAHSFVFEDSRLDEMLFRYRARNYPETLSESEKMQWSEYCYTRLTDPAAGASIAMDEYLETIHQLLDADDCSERDDKILNGLLEYGDHVLV